MKKNTLFVLIVFSITLQGQNKLFSSIQEYYNGISWEKSYGANYEYDANNNLISDTNGFWDGSAWQTNSKTIYTYNASNKATEELHQSWSVLTNKFEDSNKTAYTYTNGVLTEMKYSEYSSPNWVVVDRTTITYNSNNLPEIAVSEVWSGSAWVKDYRSQLTYYPNNMLKGSIDDKWINGGWVADSRTTITYNVNNKVIINKSDDWIGSDWVESYRSEYDYDATGNKIIETQFSDSDNYREEYTYDPSSLMSSYANPFEDKLGIEYFFEGSPYINKLLKTTGFFYDGETSTYEMFNRTVYDYSNYISLATEKMDIVNNNIIVFPNPTSDFLTIQNLSNLDVSNIIITDISGKIVLQHNKITNQLDVQNLAKGMYILQVSSGNKKFQSKFVKE